ncbi:meiotic recombination protein REC114 [Carassius auratus]|uniref:Meiotic recombination protein REC114-like n=1 Tax=Carassius auratus TaxID=7957 RepID=A0A6P6LNX9_CARAU|nr:meiotic recombination protein REC114-like [Carassius auratus]XP_026086244.1 meiotic recombination protein REC114-like [Carassius auratus]XP_026086245.1 meiotic recombination protein REC114-like [Carassius auratus]XP_026086246.1 meiotic recombination protein REC114-like [Carassius auratus]
MESGSSTEEHSKDSTISICVWKLRRYGRFIPEGKAKPKSSACNVNCAWKIFESSESAGQLELNILASGHLLVSQGQELLEGFSLLDAQSFLKIQHKSDSLLFNMTIKGESRLVRLQFDGSSRAEAAGFCSKAVERLQDYVPVQQHLSTPASAAPSDPAEPGPSTQQQLQQAPGDAPREAPAAAKGPLSIKHLSQFFLGERELCLPMAYHQCTLPSGGLEALLRLCLLDSGFPAFVEEVEEKLKELTQE